MGGAGGTGRTPGAAGDAIYSAGAGTSIGPIANTGQIIGDVEIDNQANVTVSGGGGTAFGRWTGGTITVGNGNLTFAGGNTTLADNIVVNGGAGTVFNNDPLRIDTPITIDGNFTQNSGGTLDLTFAGDAPATTAPSPSAATPPSPAIWISFRPLVSRSWRARASTSCRSPACRTILTRSAISATIARRSSGDVWTCGAGPVFREIVGSTSLDIYVQRGVPEPSTWAMLAAGFLGLGVLARRRRKSPLAA